MSVWTAQTYGVLSSSNSSALSATAYRHHGGSPASAASAGGTTLALAASASTSDGAYNGLVLEILQGAGAGETRLITGYDGGTKTATVGDAWVAAPDTASVYTIHPNSGQAQNLPLHLPHTRIKLKAHGAANGDFFNHACIRLVGGQGAGQLRHIVDYDASTAIATVDHTWEVLPNATTHYAVFGEGGLASATGASASNVVLPKHSAQVAAGMQCEVVAGTNAGQVRTLGAVSGAFETVTVTVVQAASSTMDGDWFRLRDSADALVAFWIDLDAGGTAEPSHGAARAVQVTTVADGDSASAAATKLAAAINDDPQFTATAAGAVVTVVSVLTGARTAPSGDTSDATEFTLAQSAAGAATAVGVTADWPAACDGTTRYHLFGGFAGALEGVSRYSEVRVLCAVDSRGGEQCAIVAKHAQSAAGGSAVTAATQMRPLDPLFHRTLAVASSHFALKVVGMGTALTGAVQTHFSTSAAHEYVDPKEATKRTDTQPVLAVAAGELPSGSTKLMSVFPSGAQAVSLTHPLTAFGELSVSDHTPELQLKFVYGIDSQSAEAVFALPVLLTVTTEGAMGAAQALTLTLPSGAAFTSSGSGDYWQLSSTTTDYYVWFNVDAGNSDPAPGGTGVQVSVGAADSAATVAAAAATAVGAVGGSTVFTASAAGSKLTVTNQTAGATNDTPTAGTMPTAAESTTAAGGSLAVLTCAAATESRAELVARRAHVYRPGQGGLARFTAIFAAAASGLRQRAGMGNINGGYYFATDPDTAEFGIERVYGGAPEVRTMTVSATGSSSVVEVVLDGVRTNFTVSNATSTAGIARDVANQSFAAADFDAVQNGSTVIFISKRAGPRNGSYSFANPLSSMAASFAATTTGVAVSREWVPQTQWNMDRMDGLGPSGFLLNIERGNIYQFRYQWHGFGVVVAYVVPVSAAGARISDGMFTPVHVIRYPGSSAAPSVPHPNLFLRWLVENTGSKTSASALSTASGATFNEGAITLFSPKFTAVSNAITPGSDNVQYIALAIRLPRVFQGEASQAEAVLQRITVANDGTKNAFVRVFLNPAISEITNFSYVDSASAVQVWAPSSSALTGFSGGVLLATVSTPGNGGSSEKIEPNIRLAQRDLLLVTVSRFATSVSAVVSLQWVEDH